MFKQYHGVYVDRLNVLLEHSLMLISQSYIRCIN